MTYKLSSTKQNTATIIFKAPTKEVKKFKEQTIQTLAKKITIKGFRPGKAPLNLIKNQIDPQEIKNHILESLLKESLPQAIKNLKLTLIGNPQVTQINDSNNKPWQITVQAPLLPEIKLSNYKAQIKKALRPKKLDHNQKISLIYQALIQNAILEISPLLIEKEVNFSLSRLLQQSETLGITIEQYLKSIGKTSQNLKNEYKQKATDNLKLEFILMHIAKQQKISANQKDIEGLISATADAKIKQNLTLPQNRPHLEATIIKNKTIDYLINL